MKKWIVIIVLLIAGAATAGYFYLNSGKETEDASETSVTASSQSEQPSGSETVTVVIDGDKSLTTLASSLKTAALTEILTGTGPYTIIAPTDDAFKALPAGTLVALLKADNVKQLISILNYHIISGNITSSQLTNGARFKTMNGQEVAVEVTDGKTYFVDAKGGKALVQKKDVKASNGVVHVVNAVILPQ